MNKKDLREKYKTLRKSLVFDEIMNDSLNIANHCLDLPIWDKTYFHLFLPIEKQKEINTEFILQILSGRDKEVVVSKSNFETREMTHYLLTDNTQFQVNDYGIPEPVEGIEVPVSKINVVFVPLLAYDKKGNRVGYGKGFYDQFLSVCKPETIKIGLSYFDPEELISDVSTSDIMLDYCVTPFGVIQFK
ncbi:MULTISPECIES: 5-formyltetrahydrofolate cyclo-ligase [Flavobacterium]|uniref:5-formyltetrahydrofolate cyclo-ligase n=1 Tax=Flavobacterium columnare TaxID=996 RepID=A0AA94JMU2_9FLAO|nr:MULTISPECIES: 5-formyltetrahydrofolate cyclo-ligase [Flavobacterium]AMA50476.1 5-formyltetrahydrofolate cyclo-ligase [Flavobacterium covae]MCH4829513.1 5-formyltetrahydrofolate cyclo-ligase [Flavobacterium columnare]MCH4831491.1 5-formyltetrahydrofolate cyclo-ligase [Flavobacterium columnare]MCJ1809043.1 5-formyltetrahydrofolate cyclo-ligase [Flavobacterium covae]OWP87895.1 5-formyltetrahydrofolate cyclo-ligase [Flavobacterium covae]